MATVTKLPKSPAPLREPETKPPVVTPDVPRAEDAKSPEDERQLRKDWIALVVALIAFFLLMMFTAWLASMGGGEAVDPVYFYPM